MLHKQYKLIDQEAKSLGSIELQNINKIASMDERLQSPDEKQPLQSDDESEEEIDDLYNVVTFHDEAVPEIKKSPKSKTPREWRMDAETTELIQIVKSIKQEYFCRRTCRKIPHVKCLTGTTLLLLGFFVLGAKLLNLLEGQPSHQPWQPNNQTFIDFNLTSSTNSTLSYEPYSLGQSLLFMLTGLSLMFGLSAAGALCCIVSPCMWDVYAPVIISENLLQQIKPLIEKYQVSEPSLFAKINLNDRDVYLLPILKAFEALLSKKQNLLNPRSPHSSLSLLSSHSDVRQGLLPAQKVASRSIAL